MIKVLRLVITFIESRCCYIMTMMKNRKQVIRKLYVIKPNLSGRISHCKNMKLLHISILLNRKEWTRVGVFAFQSSASQLFFAESPLWEKIIFQALHSKERGSLTIKIAYVHLFPGVVCALLSTASRLLRGRASLFEERCSNLLVVLLLISCTEIRLVLVSMDCLQYKDLLHLHIHTFPKYRKTVSIHNLLDTSSRATLLRN